MKIITAILGFIVKIIAGSLVWLIVALVACFPLGLVLFKVAGKYINVDTTLFNGIPHETELLYALFTITCFAGIILARVVAVSIKILADKKLALKSQKA